ncbi:hypothetical protein GVN20_19325 [Runella sp. CRIBMP]|uniref:hypothetical protein n=1 Tax=Runella sp. CRIBMP TaxID=2683261 RepID=UPI0014131263|nr:hypothetical protein [Runella sp. CRIBMP]NBB21527.1 hypothetical protein [Runella sp. CRIBMP]
MRTLKYGYFGEDHAQQIFLENYLLQLPVYLGLVAHVMFVRDEHFKLKGHDRPNVLRIFSEAVQQGLTFHEQDVFFVGLDLDDEKMQEHERLHGEMVGKLGGTFIDKTFIFIPVQCIEHWLLYLKYKKDHPHSNKNEAYERISRPEAKKQMYGFPRPVAEKQSKVVADLTQNMDINWLENRSASFRHFHLKVTDFLSKM